MFVMVVSGYIRFGWYGLVVVLWYAWMVCFGVTFIGGERADGSVVSGHKVRIYKEYHSVCPLVGIGTLPTPPPRTGGEGAHSPAGEGLGEPQIRTTGEKA